MYEGAYFDFLFAFQLDVGIDEVVAEYAAFGQERTALVQLFQGFFEVVDFDAFLEVADLEFELVDYFIEFHYRGIARAA